MNFAEIVKLSTNGYKVSEINELKDIAKEKPDALTLALNGTSFSDVKELISLAAAEEDTKSETVTADPGESDPEPDYKSLYEELKKESDTMKNTIKEIQKENQRTPGPAQPTEEEELTRIVRQFM